MRAKIEVQLEKLCELAALRTVSARSLAPELLNELVRVVQLRLHLPLPAQQRVQPPPQAANEVVEDTADVPGGWQDPLLE